MYNSFVFYLALTDTDTRTHLRTQTHHTHTHSLKSTYDTRVILLGGLQQGKPSGVGQ